MNQRLMDMFYAPWIPPKTLPESIVTRRHRLLDESKNPRNEPVQARTKIMAILDDFNWMTIEEIARMTSITTNTVGITTDRLYKAGKIERKKIDCRYGKMNAYRRK